MNEVEKEIDEIIQSIQADTQDSDDVEELQESDVLEVMQAISDFKSKMAKYHVSYVMTTSWETEDEQKVRVHLGGSITTVLDLLVYTVRCLPKLKELTTLNKLDFMLGMTTELRDLFNDVKKILMDDND